MSIVGSSDMWLYRAAVEFRPALPLPRSSSFAHLVASTMTVGIGFGVAEN